MKYLPMIKQFVPNCEDYKLLELIIDDSYDRKGIIYDYLQEGEIDYDVIYSASLAYFRHNFTNYENLQMGDDNRELVNNDIKSKVLQFLGEPIKNEYEEEPHEIDWDKEYEKTIVVLKKAISYAQRILDGERAKIVAKEANKKDGLYYSDVTWAKKYLKGEFGKYKVEFK